MIHAAQDAFMDTIKDSVIVILVLFLTYLGMEYLEHKTGAKAQRAVRRAGKFGPAIGALLGAFPQCGFSAAASNLYAGRVITLGTLIAIFLSTSDEMLPVMISTRAPAGIILGILLFKIVWGMIAGLLIDLCCRRGWEQEEELHIHDICEHEHCECEKGILRSAVKHTVQVGIFILLISFVLNFALTCVGEEALAGLLLNRPVLGPLVAGVVGLIPNCASSVALTELYLGGVIGMGAMLAGLLAGSGVGLLVLFRVNHHGKENVKIAGLVYLIGVLTGIAVEFIL